MIDFDDERYIPCFLEWDCTLQRCPNVIDIFKSLKEMEKKDLYENAFPYESISYEYEFLQPIQPSQSLYKKN